MSSVEISSLAYTGKAGEVKDKIMADSKLAAIKDDAGRIPLHWACAGGHTELVTFLLEKAGHLDDEDDSGWTPLMIAASAGRTEIVRNLLQCGANAKSANSTKQTSLHYAASKGHMDIARLLLEHEAEINAQDQYSNTPLHRASSKGNTKMVGFLISFPRCQLNLANSEGNTALHVACEEGRHDEAVMLVKRGAHLDALNKAGKSPLALAEPSLRKSLQRLADSG